MTTPNTGKVLSTRSLHRAIARKRADREVIEILSGFLRKTEHSCRRPYGKRIASPIVYNTLLLDKLSVLNIMSLDKDISLPSWGHDLTVKTKLLLSTWSMAKERTLSFTVRINPRLESLFIRSGQNIRTEMGKRLSYHLSRSGHSELPFLFTVEGLSKARQKVGLHLHGVFRARTDEEWLAFKSAARKASGNAKGDSAHNAVYIEGFYGVGAWIDYIHKNADVPDDRLTGRVSMYPRQALALGRSLYDQIAGANDNEATEDFLRLY